MKKRVLFLMFFSLVISNIDLVVAENFDLWWMQCVENGSYNVYYHSPLKYSSDSNDWTFSNEKDKNADLEKAKNWLWKSVFNDIKWLSHSSDGKSFAFSVLSGGKWFIVKDGVKLNKYNNNEALVYSPDGKGFAYIAEKNMKWFIVKDGAESPKYDLVNSPVYSPDGKGFAYVVETEKDKKWFIVKDGIEGPKYDFVGSPVYSPDGKGFAYIAEKGSDQFVVKDGIEGPKYDRISSLTYSPNGKSFAFIVESYEQEYVVKDGIKSKDYLFVSSPTYSPDGKSFAFLGTGQNSQSIVECAGIKDIENRTNTKIKVVGDNLIKKIINLWKGDFEKEKTIYLKVFILLDQKIKEWNPLYRDLKDYLMIMYNKNFQ